MKKTGILVSLLIGTMAIGGCGKKASSTSPAKDNSTVVSKVETQIVANHELKSINLRQAEAFAVLAHTSISSVPNSSITGKVGLRPGTRAQIALTAQEVAGGASDIFAGDDTSTPFAFVTQAKIDMINAYNEAENRVADADKINVYGGKLGGKVLPAGCYQFGTRVTIPNDLTLEGTASDVFVFKVAGELRVGSDVQVKLSGGALAKNVFWQVGDNVLIKPNSKMVGTIMSQQTFEMKEQSTLEGRAFVKNDSLVLDKNTITKPE